MVEFIQEKQLPGTFIKFYLVGLLLFIIPYSRPFFLSIVDLSLLFVIFCIFYHHKKWDLKTILIFIFIGLSSFFLEVMGVYSGILFGAYNYDISLGLQIWNTPLIIGLNWLFLVYASNSIAYSYTKRRIWRILGGACLMVFYDLIMEIVAPQMQMWHFDRVYPPIENFIVWFSAALFFHTILVLFDIKTVNKPANSLFWTQIAFFSILSLLTLLGI